MRHLSYHQAVGFMTGCLLVAAVLRLPGLLAAPPGLHFDEATNALLSADIGLHGARPLFTPGFTGQEPLFFYLAGGMMSLIGRSVFALRLTSAFVGLLTIAATYRLGQEMLGDKRISLIAAALLAVSFWHLLFSRLGLRAISQPLLQVLAMAALFRGLRQHSWRWLTLAGILVGLTAYTYLASRLFPFVLLITCLPLLFNRGGDRRRWVEVGLVAGAALVVVAPLLNYFLLHPDAFWVRVNQVAPGEAGLSLGESYLRSLGMFFVRGDPYWRFNVPGRPLFDWFWGGLLVVGWLLCGWRLRQITADDRRAAVLLLIAAPLIMLLATALTTHEIVPSNLRTLGLIPFIFYLPAIGLVFLFQDLESWFKLPPAGLATVAAGILLLILGGLSVAQIYFERWAIEPFVFYESDGDLVMAAPLIDTLPTADSTLYVAALHYQHPTLAFLSSRYNDIKWLPDSQAIVFPPQGTAVYIFPRSSPLPEWAAPLLQSATQLPAPLGPDHQPAYAAYQLAAAPELVIPNPIQVNFAYAITLLGYEVPKKASGETLPVTLYWRVQGVPPAEFKPFIHLEDAWRYRWGQTEPFVYPVAQWAVGDTIVQQAVLSIPPGAPPGDYRLRVGWFNEDTQERLSVLDENGRYAGDAWLIEGVPISAGGVPDSLPAAPFLLDIFPLPGLQLLGYERGATTVATGEAVWLGLWWRATESLPFLNLRFELYRPNNSGYILATTQPVYDSYPFNYWTTPQLVIDHQALSIPADFLPGEYRLSLRMLDVNDETVLTTDLGPLTVIATERLFTAPAVEHRVTAVLGNEIVLLGYTLQETADGHTLSLVWQAENKPTGNYTVFVHVLDANGVCCLWQQDVMPKQNQYPTTRWLPGEVVIDQYPIVLPEGTTPGQYAIEVGLYVAENGRRLRVTMPGQEATDTIFLKPLINE